MTNSIGSRIRHYRERLGWTLDELAMRSGVDRGTISALEVRRSNRSEKFGDIARAFGLTIEQLADADHDWPVQNGKVGAPDTTSLPAQEPVVAYVTKGYTDKALDLAAEFDAIRSKRWRQRAYSYCMQIMNQDPLMMAWLESLGERKSGDDPPTRKPPEQT